MADRAASLEFFKRYHGRIREPSLAGMMCDLDREERKALRERLQDPAYELDDERFRPRLLVALDSLDSLGLLEDPEPSNAVRKQTKALLARVARA